MVHVEGRIVVRNVGTALFSLLGAALLAIGPARAETFSLREALSVAYETNPQLDGARAAVRALDEGVAQANAGWRPSVNASGSYGLQQGDGDGTFLNPAFSRHPLIGQLTVTEPIFRGGRTVAQVGRAIAQARAGRWELLAAEQSILLASVTAYMDVVRDSLVLKYNRENLRTLQTQLEAVRTQFASGAVTKTDVSESEARHSRSEADVANAEKQLVASRAAFTNVIGRPPETLEGNSPLPALPRTRDDAEEIALAQHPDVLDAKARAKAADYAVDDAAGALLPQVAVQGQYQFLKDAAGSNIFATKKSQQVLSVTGQVSVPIYQGGGDEATVRRAKHLSQQSEIAIAASQRVVVQDVAGAWQEVLSAATAIRAGESQVPFQHSGIRSLEFT